MEQINKDMYISDLLEVDDELTFLLMEEGMHCVGCLSAIGETLEEAAIVHGLDPDALEAKLNSYLASKTE